MEQVVPGVMIDDISLDRLMFIKRLVDTGKLTDYVYEPMSCGKHVVLYGYHRDRCWECYQ